MNFIVKKAKNKKKNNLNLVEPKIKGKIIYSVIEIVDKIDVKILY